MSRQEDFYLFCLDHHLEKENPASWEFFRRDEKGLPWGAEERGECPACGKGCAVSNGKWFCHYCAKGGQLPDGVELTPEQQAAEQELRREKQAENREKALKIWGECVPIGANNTVATYLGTRRLELPPDPDQVMRWHPKCPFGPRTKEPCIVSLFRSAQTDEPTGIHRTHITDASRGKKSEPMALGIMAGSAIKLWPLTSGHESLTIGEGIETVLAAVKLGIGEAPAWAATVAGNLSRIPVIPGIRLLVIAADNDQSGKEHASILRRRWRDQGREVRAKIPVEVGKDFNDVLMEGRS